MGRGIYVVLLKISVYDFIYDIAVESRVPSSGSFLNTNFAQLIYAESCNVNAEEKYTALICGH